jgi:hypothetical protein
MQSWCIAGAEGAEGAGAEVQQWFNRGDCAGAEQMQRFSKGAEVQRWCRVQNKCKGAECRISAKMQLQSAECRGGGLQDCRGAEMQRCRYGSALVLKWRCSGAEDQVLRFSRGD